MLTSIALIFICGLVLSEMFHRLHLPRLLGYIIVGLVMGPYAYNLIDASIINIAADLRQIALVIILTRAGLSLELDSLKRVGRPAILMCFIPACIEMIGTVILGPMLLHIGVLDAAIIGATIAAVSPAVIVPRMIKLMEEGYGKKHSIPSLILAGASVDDVFVIVVFYAFTSLALTGKSDMTSFALIPVSIVLGVLLGYAVGVLLEKIYKMFHMRDTVKVLVTISTSFLILEFQNLVADYVTVSGLIAIMTVGIVLKMKYEVLAVRLQVKYNKLWVGAELLLFVLVGAAVNLEYALKAGIAAIVLVYGALIFRMVGVALCLVKTPLTKKERIFCMIAYTPKATVQAALCAVPLSMGLPVGELVLTVAVLSILITAPFGAIGIDNTYTKLLEREI